MIRVIIGPPCAGKSTYVNESAAPNDLRVDYDAIAMTLGSDREHESSGIVREAAFAAREAAIHVALNRPEANAWIIHTSPTQTQLEEYSDVGAEFIRVDPGKETCIARAEADGRPEETKDVIERWYDNSSFSEERKSMSPTPRLTKTMPMLIKATEAGTDDSGETLESGEFEAIVSAFGNVDSYGDVVVQGAFSDSLKEWDSSGDPIPVVWSHKWDDPHAHIGVVTEAVETDKGLKVKGTIDTDTATGAQVYRLLKGRRVTQMSFAYDVLEAGWATYDGEEVFELRKLAITEVGPCLRGVNQETELLAVKATRDAFPTGASNTTSQARSDGATTDPNAGEAAATIQSDPASVRRLADIQLLEGSL